MQCCSNCGHHQFRRLARQGVVEHTIMSLLGLFPWACASCGKKIYLQKRQAI
jgi:hypothetical protein